MKKMLLLLFVLVPVIRQVIILVEYFMTSHKANVSRDGLNGRVVLRNGNDC